MDASTLADRIRQKHRLDPTTGCWNWTGHVDKYGYGRAWDPIRQRMQVAHRLTYMLEVGEIPSGLVIDHLCRNRRCVNPAHLEAVSNQENLDRGRRLRGHNTSGMGEAARPNRGCAITPKTACANGHEWKSETTRMVRHHQGHWYRRCKPCDAATARARRARNLKVTDDEARRS